jgi:hypothetical protein
VPFRRFSQGLVEHRRVDLRFLLTAFRPRMVGGVFVAAFFFDPFFFLACVLACPLCLVGRFRNGVL